MALAFYALPYTLPLSNPHDQALRAQDDGHALSVVPGTEALPVVTSLKVFDVEWTTARLEWDVGGPGAVVSHGICQGLPDPAPVSFATVGTGWQSMHLAGLVPGTSYVCHVEATSADGVTSPPSSVGFRTRSVPPA